jgi:plastocyanin
MRSIQHRLAFALALAALLGLRALPSLAANHMIVTGPGLVFTPSSLTITAGDTVTFANTSEGNHDVHADDNSFRCANGCDGSGGNGDPSPNAWSFTLTFKTAGTVAYYCEIHGGPGGQGMHGVITVNAGSAPPPPPPAAGTLGFSRSAYSVAENAGNATIVVQRTAGSGGAVSVQYSTSNGTGTAGTQYKSASGTLNWADGDAAAKSFQVPVLDDGQVDGSHNVNLALKNATGGATLGTAGSLLTITNTDTSGGGNPPPPPPSGAPAAPSGLTATPVDTANITLAWTLNSTDDTAVRVQSKPLDGSTFQDVLPVLPAGTTTLTVSGLQPGTGYGFQVRAENATGNSAYTPEVDAATFSPVAACVPGAATLCLGDSGRFQVTAAWVDSTGNGLGSAIPLAANPDSGLFYFFSAGNIEMLIKVLNACTPPFNDYWVFFAATTNVQFAVTVVDTTNGQTRVYFNPLNQAALPIQDTSAFATCP